MILSPFPFTNGRASGIMAKITGRLWRLSQREEGSPWGSEWIVRFGRGCFPLVSPSLSPRLISKGIGVPLSGAAGTFFF